MKVNGSTYNVYTSSTSLPTIYAPTAVGTAGQVLATNSNADGLEWKSVATTTKAMKVNGTNYNIYTTGTSLPTIYAPTSLGTAGQVLKMNGDGTGLTWATDATIANTWRPVKAVKSDGSDLGTLSDNSTTLSLKAGSNITLAYSSGTITITGVGNTWTALGGATASTDGTAGYAPKPTKGQQGYYLKGNATWVKPSLSEFTDDVVAGNYLSLSGGTLTNNTAPQLTLKSSSGSDVYQYFTNSDDKIVHVGLVNLDDYGASATFGFNHRIIIPESGGIFYRTAYNGTTHSIWHSGNDGSGSGLDADLLDGKHLSDILASNVASATKATYLKTQYSDSTSWYDNYLLYGKWATDNSSICDFKCDNYSVRVDIAKKLNTARTLWGQSFDGSGNVYGDLVVYGTSENNTNAAAGKLWFNGIPNAGYGNGVYITGIHHATYGRKRLGIYQSNDTSYTPTWKEVFTILPDGNVGIGNTNPTYKLHVSGGVAADTVSVSNSATGMFVNRTTAGTYPHITFKSQGNPIGDIGFGGDS